MGFLRTVTLYNDRWHQYEIRANPEEFIRVLTESMDRVDKTHSPDRITSYLRVQTSRHADDHTVFVHRGNTVIDIGHRSFDALSPDIQRNYLKTAQEIVTWRKKRLKESASKRA
jgi:hypothetical protein